MTTSSLEISVFDRMRRAIWDPEVVTESDRQLATMAGFAENITVVNSKSGLPKSHPRKKQKRKLGFLSVHFNEPSEKD